MRNDTRSSQSERRAGSLEEECSKPFVFLGFFFCSKPFEYSYRNSGFKGPLGAKETEWTKVVGQKGIHEVCIVNSLWGSRWPFLTGLF